MSILSYHWLHLVDNLVVELIIVSSLSLSINIHFKTLLAQSILCLLSILGSSCWWFSWLSVWNWQWWWCRVTRCWWPIIFNIISCHFCYPFQILLYIDINTRMTWLTTIDSPWNDSNQSISSILTITN